MKALEQHIVDDEYCINLLTQSLAMQRSLASLNKLILENHLRTHTTRRLSSNDKQQHEKAIDELLSLYELHNIRGRS